MTRRLFRPRRAPGIDAYIRRATLGLPREQRLDTAAELRTHLLERVAEFEKQGFAREEAEYLAVKGMGEPEVTNRGLLGHVFTYRLGWAVLAPLVLGGGGWYAWREWWPPRVGIYRTEFTPEDAKFLFTQPQAPRGDYLSYVITYPKPTVSIVLAFVSEDVRDVQVVNLQALRGNQQLQPPGSYRFQQRVLLLPAATDPRELPWSPQCDSTGLYFIASEVPSPLIENRIIGGQVGGYVPYGACFEAQKKLAAQLPLQSFPDWWQRPMKLNEWSLVFSGGAGWDKKDRSLVLMVLPTERNLTPQYPYFTAHNGRIHINGDSQDLPPLPALP